MGEKTKDELRRMKMQEQLNIEFRRTLTRKYEAECKRHEIEPTMDGLLDFAEKHGLIRSVDVQRYMVFDKYPAALYNNNGCRTKAVAELEDVIPVSDRTIWGWLTNFRARHLKHRTGK